MKITNKLNLPEPIVEAIKAKGYDKGRSDITATGLIEPPRISALKKLHEHEMSEDAIDLIYSLDGQSLHVVLERAALGLNKEDWIVEKRYYAKFGNVNVGAQIDIFSVKDGLLQDYKKTSVYSVKNGIKEEYAQQMNIQAELLRRNGIIVKKMQIVAILRDWSKREREREVKEYGPRAKYPEHQVKIIDVPIIDSSEVTQFIEERIALHKQASVTLPLCTKEERWAKDDVWAVLKKGQKRAVRLFNSEEAAQLFLADLDKNHVVGMRQGESTRCEAYCPVAKWCTQFQESKKK